MINLLRSGILCLFLLSPSVLLALEAPRLKGEFRQGGMVVGQTCAGCKVWFRGKPLQVSDEGDFVFGFGRDETQPVHLKLVSPSGEVWERRWELEKRQYQEQFIDGLPKNKVTPPAEVQQRISSENALVKKARAQSEPMTFFKETFIWPALGPITGVYGSRRILNGIPKWPHYGVDVAAPTGTTVVAPADGIVRLVHPDMYYTGGTLIVDHGFGVSSTFIHLSKILVREGQKVAQGEKIAEIGASGRATGPHLDWRINWYQTRIDPQLVVGEMPPKPWVCSRHLPQACP